MILFKIASRLIKYLGINLTKEVKVVCIQALKHWKKEIEEDSKK